MIGWAVVSLTCRAGWHNCARLVNQLGWRSEGSLEVLWPHTAFLLCRLTAFVSGQVESFHKPIFISYCAILGLAAYFPFCGLSLNTMSKNFIRTSALISVFQLATIYFLALALQYLPISIAIITRVSRSWACDKHLRISVALE